MSTAERLAALTHAGDHLDQAAATNQRLRDRWTELCRAHQQARAGRREQSGRRP